MDKLDYDQRMETMLKDTSTYEKVNKSPFHKIERQLSENLMKLKKAKKLDDKTYFYTSTTTIREGNSCNKY